MSGAALGISGVRDRAGSDRPPAVSASGTVTLREAVGARPHEGLRFDRDGNLYGISETGPGYIYKFVPLAPAR